MSAARETSLLRNPDFPRGSPDKNNMTHALAGLVPPLALTLQRAPDALHALPDLMHRCPQFARGGALPHAASGGPCAGARGMAGGH